MILKELCRLYEELQKDHADAIPDYFQGKASVCAEIVLSKAGNPVSIRPLYRENKGRITPLSLIVPERVVRTSGMAPNFLCDNASYLVGIDKGGFTASAAGRFASSAQLHGKVLTGVKDEGAQAVLLFFDKFIDRKTLIGKMLAGNREIAFLVQTKANMVFRLEGDGVYLHERPAVQSAWFLFRQAASRGAASMQSLVGGADCRIARSR